MPLSTSFVRVLSAVVHCRFSTFAALSRSPTLDIRCPILSQICHFSTANLVSLLSLFRDSYVLKQKYPSIVNAPQHSNILKKARLLPIQYTSCTSYLSNNLPLAEPINTRGQPLRLPSYQVGCLRIYA